MNHKNEPLKCIWMTAGIVDYKLCEQEYDCDHCALDRALRGMSSEHREVDRLTSPENEQGFRLDGASFYHPAHLWLRVEKEGCIRVGLDDFGRRLTGRIYSVRLPNPGSVVDRDAGCWSLAHGRGEVVLSGGARGKVIEANRKLEMLPSLMNSDPYGKGWAFVIEPDNLPMSLKSLYYGDGARSWITGEIQRLRREMDASISEMGATLPDGGILIPDFRIAVPDSRIINLFLSARESDPEGAGNASSFVRR